MTRAQVEAHAVRVLTEHGVPHNEARVCVGVCHRIGAPVSLGAALEEQESGFRKVWGHDPAPNGGTSSWGGLPVTRVAVRQYLRVRGPTGRGGMQGCGETQLTYYAFQDDATRLGGLWKAQANVTVGVGHAWTLVRRYGWHAGLRAYNGTGPAADRYAAEVRALVDKWHRRLT